MPKNTRAIEEINVEVILTEWMRNEERTDGGIKIKNVRDDRLQDPKSATLN